jgi:hypothetical protein
MIRCGSSRPCCVVPDCSWWWFSEPFPGVFLGLFSGPFSWGFDGVNLWEPFVVLWAMIPLPNPWVKGLDFGVFRVLGLEVFLVGFLQFLLFGQVLVGLNLAMNSSWGVPIIPKVLFKSVERFRKSRFGFGGVDPRVLFIPSCPGYTGLTGALERSDRCNLLWVFARVNVWVSLLLSCVGAVSSLGKFGGRLASFAIWELSGIDRSDRCVAPAWPVWSHLVEVAKFHLQGLVWPVVLTGLTGVGQWTWGLVFRCVLGLEGCVLVPRSSGTPVAMWAWPIWVVSRRRVLEAVFILLEFPSPSRRIFIGCHSLTPSLVRRIGPSTVGRVIMINGAMSSTLMG